MRGWRPGCVDLVNCNFACHKQFRGCFLCGITISSFALHPHKMTTTATQCCVLFAVALCGEIWLINDCVARCLFCCISTSKSSKHCIYLWGCLFILVVILVVVFILWGWGWWDGETANGKAVGNQTKVCFQHTIHIASHTNRRNKGWTSADRSTKATLMLTVPRPLVKSSTKDLTRPTFVIAIRRTCPFNRQCRQSIMLTRKLLLLSNIGRGEYRRLPAWILT